MSTVWVVTKEYWGALIDAMIVDSVWPTEAAAKAYCAQRGDLQGDSPAWWFKASNLSWQAYAVPMHETEANDDG